MPFFAILQKYRNQVTLSLTQRQLEKNLVELGFKNKGESGAKTKFSRGSLLKDFSVEHAPVDVCLYKLLGTKHEVALIAGWAAAFDTGDLWQLTELSKDRDSIINRCMLRPGLMGCSSLGPAPGSGAEI